MTIQNAILMPIENKKIKKIFLFKPSFFFLLLSTIFIGSDIYNVQFLGVNLRLVQIFLVLAALFLIFENKFKIHKNKALIYLTIAHIVSSLLAYNVFRSLLFDFSLIYNIVFLFYLYSSFTYYYGINYSISLFRSSSYIQAIIMLFQVAVFYIFNIEFSFLPTYGSYRGVQRFSLWFYEPSYLSTYLMIWCSIAWYYVLVAKNKKYILDIIVSSLMIFISSSTSGFIGLVIVIILTYILSIKRNKNFLTSIFFPIIILTAFIISIFVFNDVYKVFILRLFNSTLNSASGGRIENSFFTLQVWSSTFKNILFGVGPGCYGLYILNDTQAVTSNLTADLLSSGGLLFTFSFYLFCINLTSRAIKINKKIYSPWVSALILALWVFTIVLQFNQGYLRLYHWMLFGLIDGAIRYDEKKYLNKTIFKEIFTDIISNY